MQVPNHQQSNQNLQGRGGVQANNSNLSSINQQILQKLKEQQQMRMAQKKLAEQEQLYESEPIYTDLIPASGQFMKSSDVQHQSQQTLNKSKNLISQSQSQQKMTSILKNKSINNTQSQNQSIIDESLAKDHLLVMTIDLGEGNCDILHIYEYDDPPRKAMEFCSKHGLTKEAMEILAKNIEVNKQIVITERQHSLYHQTQHLRSTSPSYANNTQTDNYYSNTSQQAIRQNYYRSAQSVPTIDNSNEQLPIHLNSGFSSPQQNDQIIYNQNKENYNQSAHDKNGDYQVSHPTEKQSIFERLHGEAARKKQRFEQKKQQLESSMHMNSTCRSTKRVVGDTVVNLGEFLYLKGEQLKENKKRNIENFLISRQIEQDKHLSFKPNIDPVSVKICVRKINILISNIIQQT